MEEDANQNPAALPPTTPDDDDNVVGHSGLHNVSNTCYLNATVQVRTRNVSLALGKIIFFHFCSLGARFKWTKTRRVFFSSSSSLSLSLFSGNAHSKDKTALHRKDAQIILSFLFLCVCLTPAGVVRFGTVPSVFTERRMRTTVGGTPDARAKEKVSRTTTTTTTGRCERSREASEICFIDEEEEE